MNPSDKQETQSNGECIRRLTAVLDAGLSGACEVIITDNRSSMISVRKVRGVYRVRLHRMFLHATPEVLTEIPRYVKTGKLASAVRKYIDENAHRIRATKCGRRRVRICHAGRYYNVKEVFDSLNRTYFDSSIQCLITWGKKSTGKNRRSIRFGSFKAADNIIRIHPALDSSRVPEYFIAFIVYHEMLHCRFRPSPGRVHPPEFRKAEEGFREYERAVAWERRNRRLFFR